MDTKEAFSIVVRREKKKKKKDINIKLEINKSQTLTINERGCQDDLNTTLKATI
jgi:hypothetical protein